MGIWLLEERRRSSLGKTKSLGKPVGIIWGKSVDSDEVILYTVILTKSSYIPYCGEAYQRPVREASQQWLRQISWFWYSEAPVMYPISASRLPINSAILPMDKISTFLYRISSPNKVYELIFTFFTFFDLHQIKRHFWKIPAWIRSVEPVNS